MRLLAFCTLGLTLAAVLGCGGSSAEPPDLGGEDGQEIANLVERLNDDGGRQKNLKALFASGSSTPQARGFAQYRFDLKGKPTVTGTTATGNVVMEKNAGGSPVEKEWTFVKEGDKWKLKSAPLP